MNKLRSIIILAAMANLLTFLLYQFGKNELSPSGNASFFITLCIMAVWLTTFIVALELARRNSLFSTKSSVWAILIIQFCTPFPMLGLYYALGTQPELMASNNKQAIHKHYNANNLDKEVKGESLYPSNAAWSYTRKPHSGIK
jgi:hypothetical protein